MSGSGVILCVSYDVAVAHGDGYEPRPIPDTDAWLAVPKHPADRLAVDRQLAIWNAGPPATRTRATDPTTSLDAAARAATVAMSNRMLCLHAHVYAGDRGLTGTELATATGRPYEAIGPRRPSLEQAGLIRKATGLSGGLRRRGGKQVYVVTPAGIAHYQQHRGAA
jgi:hypothetical protein